MKTAHRPIVSLEGVRKSFSGLEVIRPLTLNFENAEFITLLGPSGCGKSTILRLIAGLEVVDSGRILVDGVDVTKLPPNKRPVNMVFQRAALFPHLSVFENIAFGLRLRRVERGQVRERVLESLEMVRLPGFEDRDVETLSGGEAQRVALARALVNRPKVLLLDEPLGALDLQIRRHLQVELKHLHREVGATFVFVTHDQEEAMTMSDRIVVISEGSINQVGSPIDIYQNPSSLFTASFVGTSNLWPGVVQAVSPQYIVLDLEGDEITVSNTGGLHAGEPAWALIRAEAVSVARTSATSGRLGPPSSSLSGTVADAIFLGSAIQYRINAGTKTVIATAPAGTNAMIAEGTDVVVTWDPGDVRALAG